MAPRAPDCGPSSPLRARGSRFADSGRRRLGGDASGAGGGASSLGQSASENELVVPSWMKAAERRLAEADGSAPPRDAFAESPRAAAARRWDAGTSKWDEGADGSLDGGIGDDEFAARRAVNPAAGFGVPLPSLAPLVASTPSPAVPEGTGR